MVKKKFLIIEDEMPLLNAISLKMQKSGAEVATARSADEAKKILHEFDPDLIWLDHYLLGDEDGIEILKRIKKDTSTASIPVFLVSNTCTDEKYQEYHDLGVKKYYLKSSCRLDEVVSDAMSIA
ncbi:MAG: Transcriptional regulatory protein YycF [bacterium ADurb.Bin212]|jgi:two-component system phosphate regulon response regulator PhoB|nr:MAG: Transcriptional regulatory protein YycF [bacterium ADurb.Bin212]